MKLAGLLLLFCLCVGSGIWYAKRLKNRQTMLSALISALNRLKTEISYRATPVAAAARELATGVCGPFFEALATGLETGRTVKESWTQARERLGCLKEEELRLLGRFMEELGLSDRKTQCERIEQTTQDLGVLLLEARREAAQKGRAYRILGAVCGAVLAIMLV